MIDGSNGAEHFLDLIRRSRRGKFKIYIGMMAGVGKTYRMLQEAHELLNNGIDVRIGYVETHGRPGTEAMLRGVPVIPRKVVFYKGREIEEMDLDAILQARPELVIVDELAKMGILCNELPDGVKIHPGTPKNTNIETYNDHRVAMSFAVTGLAGDGMTILKPMCCKKTFAGFFDEIDRLEE